MNNKKLSIRVLFPLIMSISIVFCILSCMILFSHYISTYLVRKTIEETSRQKNVLAQNIENEIDSINSIMNNIYYNTIKKYDIQDKNFKTILANEITSNSEIIYGLALYDTDGKNLWHSNNLTSTSMQNESWFTQAKDNIETICYGSKKLVYPDNVKQVFQISRYVEYINHGKMKSGVLLMQYYTDSIDAILEHYKNTQTSYCYLLDNTSNFLYHPFIKEISSGLYKENTTKIALNSTNYSIKKLHGTKWLIERQQIGYTGWNIVLVSSLFNIHTENMGIYYVIWLLLLIVGIILVFTDILLFHDFTNPVYQLLDTMQEFGKGNYEVKAAENGIGELKTLSAHFNIMAEKLQNQMDEIRRNEREKRKMEKKLLQSQINPHFLYNTLDSIIWMIQSGEYKGAEQMVSSLAKFFRISLSQGKDIIPLEKELEHATSYLAILFIAFFSSQCMMTRTNTESKKTVAVILPYTYNKENSRILDAIRDYAHNNSIILDVWHEKSLSSNELSSIIANEEQNHAIGILLIYPENYLTQQEKHYDYNNVLAITATMQTAFSHYAAFENSPSSSYLLPVSAQVIKKIQYGKTDCIYIKNTYELGYESIQMLDTYSRNKYMKDISIPCHKVDKAAIESGELDALLTN